MHGARSTSVQIVKIYENRIILWCRKISRAVLHIPFNSCHIPFNSCDPQGDSTTLKKTRPVWKSPNLKGGEMRDPIELHPNTNGVAPP